MSGVGLNNPNLPEKRDLNNKELKNNLGIEKIREVKDDTKLDDFIENEAAGNGKDEVLFQAGRKGKLYMAEGKNIDMDMFSELYNDDEHPLKFNGKEIGIGFIDDQNMELNGRSSGKSAFDIEGIRELNVPVKEAIEKTRRDGIDQIFFRAGGKDYVAYGKDINMESFIDVADKSSKAGDPMLFNGQEISIYADAIDDEANTFRQGFNHALDKNQGLNATICVGAAAVGGSTAGLMGLAVYPVVAVGSAMVVEGTVGGVRAMFNKPDSKGMDQITGSDITAPDKK
jgi:hypothetical protein